MKKLIALIILIVSSVFVLNWALADEHKGKKMDKPQHKEMKKAANTEHKEGKRKDRDDDEHDDDDDKYKSSENSLEKQREKKVEQERKEIGKGSEQGQASREEHRRKWWKFWEEEN